jgi:hypothetical protein
MDMREKKTEVRDAPDDLDALDYAQAVARDVREIEKLSDARDEDGDDEDEYGGTAEDAAGYLEQDLGNFYAAAIGAGRYMRMVSGTDAVDPHSLGRLRAAYDLIDGLRQLEEICGEYEIDFMDFDELAAKGAPRLGFGAEDSKPAGHGSIAKLLDAGRNAVLSQGPSADRDDIDAAYAEDVGLGRDRGGWFEFSDMDVDYEDPRYYSVRMRTDDPDRDFVFLVPKRDVSGFIDLLSMTPQQLEGIAMLNPSARDKYGFIYDLKEGFDNAKFDMAKRNGKPVKIKDADKDVTVNDGYDDETGFHEDDYNDDDDPEEDERERRKDMRDLYDEIEKFAEKAADDPETAMDFYIDGWYSKDTKDPKKEMRDMLSVTDRVHGLNTVKRFDDLVKANPNYSLDDFRKDFADVAVRVANDDFYEMTESPSRRSFLGRSKAGDDSGFMYWYAIEEGYDKDDVDECFDYKNGAIRPQY